MVSLTVVVVEHIEYALLVGHVGPSVLQVDCDEDGLEVSRLGEEGVLIDQ